MMNTALILSLTISAFSLVVEANGSVCAQLFKVENTATARIESNGNSNKPIKDISSELGREGLRFNQETIQKIRLTGKFGSLEVKAQPLENFDYAYLRFEESIKHYLFVLKPLRDEISRLQENLEAPLSRREEELALDALDQAVKRMIDENSGIVARTSEFLSAAGVDHVLVKNESTHPRNKDTFYILIGRTGDHLVNRLARKFYEPRKSKRGELSAYKLDIVFDPATLLESRNEGFFEQTRFERRIVLDPSVMMGDSLIRNNISLHEFLHNVIAWARRNGDAKPYQAEITGLKRSETLEATLDKYSKFLSLDELLAFRTSIRINANYIIKNSRSPGVISDGFEAIRIDVIKQIQFSKHIHQVFSKLQEMERDRPHTSSFERNIRVETVDGIFKVTTAAELKVEETIAMSKFTSMVYQLIEAKLNGASSRNDQVKLRTIRQITRVLNLHSVRKLEGNYPSREEIVRMLNEEPGK